MSKRKKSTISKISAKDMFALNIGKAQSVVKAKPVLHICFGSNVEAEHCKGILQYTATNICLDMDGRFADISGDDLIIDTMQKEKIVIKGRIFSVVFRYDKKEGADE